MAQRNSGQLPVLESIRGKPLMKGFRFYRTALQLSLTLLLLAGSSAITRAQYKAQTTRRDPNAKKKEQELKVCWQSPAPIPSR
jgi:hypothetical protein